MATAAPDNITHPDTRAQWRAWLARHHARSEGVWLVMWKKASGKARMSYDEVVFEALCFGWIDSKPRALDEMRSMLWLAPRKPRTGWSAINKQRVADAIAQGRMQPAGLAKVEAAKLDGSWAALDAVERLEVPQDLAAALKALGPAHDHFAAFPRSVKRGILEWIASAKTAPTRQRRVQETAEKAARNERANQWPAATVKRAGR